MTKVKAAPETVPGIDSSELIARFQLETESSIEAVKRDHTRALEVLERKIAALADEWTRTRGEVVELKRTIEDGLHQMRQGVAEAVNAQREAVKHATAASAAAAVFDKLKASQPDFHRMVGAQDLKVAKVTDKLTHLEELVSTLSRKIDEFEVIEEDYAETKATVRGMDLIVKDLNAEHRTRRRNGVPT